MSATGHRSKPRYTELEPDPGGRYHLLAGEGRGGEALERLARKMPQGADVHLVYFSGATRGIDCSDKLWCGACSDLCVVPTQSEAIDLLDCRLATCRMGTRLYLAGSESFLGSALQVALKYNMNADEVQSEHCGSAARRVYCVHCKTANENARTNIVACAGCGVRLLVRDHYSRRLAAYMGVVADAETPGALPPIRTVYE